MTKKTKTAKSPKKSETLLRIAQKSLSDSKAVDSIVIDLAGKSDLADYMIIASGTSDRHVGSIANKLIDEMKEKGYKDLRPEGFPECDWVLVDNPYVIVHIFKPETRKFYNLEKMWQVDFSPAVEARV